MIPEEIARLSQSLTRVYEEVTDQILINIARHFNAAGNTGAAAAWQMRKLAEVGQLTKENIRIIAKLTKQCEAMLEIALQDAFTIALKDAEPALRAAVQNGFAMEAPPAELSPAMQRIFKSYYDQAKDKLNMVNTVMLESSLEQYRKVVSDTVAYEAQLDVAQEVLNAETGKVVSGVSTRTQAVRRAVLRMGEVGLTGFVDAGGHRWSPEAYVNMDIRTTAGNVATQAVFARNEEYGNDLVSVPVKADSRPLCYPWQGKVISMSNRSGTVKDGNGKDITIHPLNSTTYGQPAGLWGINCGHTPPNVFIPGFSLLRGKVPPKGENDKGYKESQMQRSIERKIRYAKRELAMAEAMGDTTAVDKAKQKVKAYQAQMRSFIKDTGRTRRRDREQIVKEPVVAVAKERLAVYNRKQDEIRQQVQSGAYPLKINRGNQNKHVPDSKGYTPGRSYIYGDLSTAQSLIDQYSGTGAFKLTKAGDWTKKEFITADHDIGVYVDHDTGAGSKTNRFSIHYGKNGTHIVPAKKEV